MAGKKWLAGPSAVALSLLLAGQALAVTWQAPVQLSAPEAARAGGLVTLGSSVAVAVYNENDRIYRRRSADSGATWSSRLALSVVGTSAHAPAIAGRGDAVDVVWQEADFPSSRIRYARSTNRGRTFSASVALTRIDGRATQPRVARGPNNRVAVIWYDVERGEVRLRVSKDGGLTFGATRRVSSTVAEAPLPVVGVGKGVVYAAYFVNNFRVRARRSLDNGASWSTPATIANNGTPFGLDLTAGGSQAFVAYVAQSGLDTWVRYRRTTNKGGSWSSPANLSSASANESSNPRLSLKGGVVRVAFDRCLDSECVGSAVFYRQSSNGTSWTAAERASHTGPTNASAAGVGYAGRIIALYTGYPPFASAGNGTVHVRRGTP
jgi:hypothetical protein